jgi:apolipoprotein N-acyltransferase
LTWRITGAFLAGALLNLAFAPFGVWPIAILAPAALFLLIRPLTPRAAAWSGAAFGAGLFSCGTYWLYTAIHGFGQAPVWLTLFLQAALVALMAVYPAALGYLSNRVFPAGMWRVWLVLPAAWVLLEWLRSWLFSGFPWLGLGYAFIDSPLAGWAPVFGVYGVTAAAAFCAAALCILATPRTAAAQRIAAAELIGVLFTAPLLLSRIAWTQPVGEP